MSDALLIAQEGFQEFQRQDVLKVLSEIPGVSALKPIRGHKGDELLEADYTVHGETRQVSLVSGCGSVSIHGNDDLALEFAIQFAKHYQRFSHAPLQLFNEAYFFHQVLSPNLDLATLKARIQATPFAGAPVSNPGAQGPDH